MVWSDKVTHTFRAYAAQLMVAFGVPLEIIQRFGGWLQDVLGTAYVTFAGHPEALLALGCWRVDKVDYHCYDDPRWACWDYGTQSGCASTCLLNCTLQNEMRSPRMQ